MRKILRLTLLMFLALVSNVALADEETLDLSAQGYTNAQEVTEVSATNFKVTFDKGTSSLPPKYYTKGTSVRVYGGNTITISSDYTITGIAISTEWSSSDLTKITAGVGTYTASNKDATWTGSANSVVLTASAKAGFGKITVTYKSDANVVASPTISGDNRFFNSTDVTITAPAGSIYYTLDGTDPTTSSNAYTAPFTISESTTVKAIAVNNGKSSAIVSKTFTKLENLTLTGDGSVENPFTVADVRKIIAADEINEYNSDSVCVKGYVKTASIETEKYGNGNFSLVDNKNDEDSVLAYRIYKSAKTVKFTSADEVKTGDLLVVKAKTLQNFNGTYEASYGYVVSINGVATRISSITNVNDETEYPLYNLAGQRVNENYKGVVIRNGKKYINK